MELFSKVGGLWVPLVPRLIKPRSFLLSDASASGSSMYLAGSAEGGTGRYSNSSTSERGVDRGG